MLDPKLLHNLSLKEYKKLKNSGMFWEYFPKATGLYFKDTKLPKEVLKNDKI